LAEPVTAKVYIRKDGQWIKSGKARLPAGAFVGPGFQD
jgi:hypothetical protein